MNNNTLPEKITIELNNETIIILGSSYEWYEYIADKLRKLGHDITDESEEELQAYVIYWMLGFYEQYGDNWRTELVEYFKKA